MTKQEPSKQPPCDVDLEAALLGSLLMDNRLIDLAAAEIEPEDFFDPLHQRLFTFVRHLATEGDVTPLIVNSVMKHDPGLVEVGGHAYLAGLAQAAPAMPNIRRLTSLLRELSMRRGIVRIGEDVVEAAHEASLEMPAAKILGEATEALMRLAGSSRAPIVTPYGAAMETLKEIEEMSTRSFDPLVKTGLRQLDDEIGGFRGGEFIVIPGASGMGKSSVLGMFSRNAAQAGFPTIVFSIEMTQRQWVDRMVCDIDFDTHSDKPLWYSKFRRGDVTAAEFSRYGEALQALDGIPLEIVEESGLTIEQIAMRARAFSAKHGHKLGLVIVDYIQIVGASEATRGRSREQEVAHIAMGLKGLAKNLRWPVIAGSQMNEGAEARGEEGRRPHPGDVRESKAIRNEADMMLSPYRLAHFLEDKKPTASPGDTTWEDWKAQMAIHRHRMELIGLKMRHGRRFDLDLYCDMAASAVRDEAPYVPSTGQRALNLDNPVDGR